MDIPTFSDDYALACYLNAIEPMNSSINEQSVNMTEADIKYLSLKYQKKKN